VSDAPNVLLLANPNAGRVDDTAIGAVCRALPSDVPVEVAVTREAGSVPGVLERLDGRLLLLMGGDGTLNVAVGALHGLGALGDSDIGFVPTGTANAFARAMDLSSHAPTAAVAALRAPARHVDLLVADDGRVAVNDLHTGPGIAATEVSRRLKPVLRQLAYPVANSAVGLASGGWNIGVTVDDTPVVDETRRCWPSPSATPSSSATARACGRAPSPTTAKPTSWSCWPAREQPASSSASPSATGPTSVAATSGAHAAGASRSAATYLATTPTASCPGTLLAAGAWSPAPGGCATAGELLALASAVPRPRQNRPKQQPHHVDASGSFVVSPMPAATRSRAAEMT
jgi:hypothetical protein